MSKGDLFAYFHRMLDRFLTQSGVPKRDKAKIKKELITGLKAAFGVESMSKLEHYERWEFVSKVEVLLISEYGYLVDNDEELKFKDLN